MIGFNPDTGVGGPWNMAKGKPSDVKGGPYIIMDESSRQRLGKLELGSYWELNLFREQSFKLVGLSREALSFTTIPVVFTSYNEIDRSLMGTDFEGQTSFIVAKLKDPSRLDEVVRKLRAVLPDNDVYTRQGFIDRTVNYWTIQTGMGMAFFLTAILAVLIGGAIVGQTIYASTMEHLRDYGTLKAMGAKNGDINLVILAQAATSAVLFRDRGDRDICIARRHRQCRRVDAVAADPFRLGVCDRRRDLPRGGVHLGTQGQDARSGDGVPGVTAMNRGVRS